MLAPESDFGTVAGGFGSWSGIVCDSGRATMDAVVFTVVVVVVIFVAISGIFLESFRTLGVDVRFGGGSSLDDFDVFTLSDLLESDALLGFVVDTTEVDGITVVADVACAFDVSLEPFADGTGMVTAFVISFGLVDDSFRAGVVVCCLVDSVGSSCRASCCGASCCTFGTGGAFSGSSSAGSVRLDDLLWSEVLVGSWLACGKTNPVI